MFPNEGEPKPQAKKRRLTLSKKAAVIGGGVLALCLIILLVFMLLSSPTVAIPKDVKQNARSPIYVPTKLPGGYKITESSFAMVEDNTILIFQANNSTGTKLIFTEQPKPKNFDFDGLYQGQFENPKTLADAPYPSTWGKASNGHTTLSIVTDDTWIMVTTPGSLSQDDLEHIAKSVRKVS